MGRKRHCSKEKRELIIKLKNEGKSYRTIANIVNCSLGLVQNAIKYFDRAEKRGRPRKTTPWMDRRILREIKKNPFASSKMVLAKIGASVSSRTIQRRLTEHNLKTRRPRSVPLLKRRHLVDRISFAREHLHWRGEEGGRRWRNILFSDESKFMLFTNDGNGFVRRPINEAFNPRYTRKTVKHGGGKILVWGCFSWYGVGPIFLIDGIMTKQTYINILEKIMLPYAQWEMPLYWTFQHDNDPKHTANATKLWLQDHNVKVLHFPAQSPDLNPIENLWKQVKDKVRAVKPTNKAELWVTVRDAWYSIPVEHCQRLVESMPNRCQAVLDNRGHATSY